MTSMNMECQTAASSATGPQTTRGALIKGAQLLRAAGIESARIDAEVLLCHVLDFDKSQLYLNLEAQLDAQTELRFYHTMARRLRREPVAYITGHQEFWSLDFHVTPDVLIPRPETERLVEIAVELAGRFHADSRLRILDLGTGSGAIAVSLSKELPGAQVWATDLSLPALAIARGNAACHGVLKRIELAGSNLFDSIGKTSEFHLIVANPPYVRRGELSTLAPEVRRWEPRTALDGGLDGLDYYRRIVAQGYSHLVPGGALLLEVGADMGHQVGHLLESTGYYAPAKLYQDYAGRERVAVAHRIAAATR